MGRLVQNTGALLCSHHERRALLSSEHTGTLHGSKQTGEEMGLDGSFGSSIYRKTEPFISSLGT